MLSRKGQGRLQSIASKGPIEHKKHGRIRSQLPIAGETYNSLKASSGFAATVCNKESAADLAVRCKSRNGGFAPCAHPDFELFDWHASLAALFQYASMIVRELLSGRHNQEIGA